MTADRWFFPTNTDNLKIILSHGLICGSEGYEKYYTDISSDFPGFVPIFRNGKGRHGAALSKAKEEGDDLVLCLLEITLEQIVSGSVRLTDYQPVDIEACRKQAEGEQINEILLPAPLPLACIKQVLFIKSSQDKNTFENDSKRYCDTPQGVLKFADATKKADKNLFNRNSQPDVMFDPPGTAVAEDPAVSQNMSPENKVNYNKIYSMGGLLYTLFYFAKNSSATNETLASCVKLKEIEKSEDDLVSSINNYFHQPGDSAKNNTFEAIILDHVLDILVSEKSSGCATAIVRLLETENAFENDEYTAKGKEIAKKLADFYHNKIDAKRSDFFSKADSPIERMLLLLLYRKDVAGLMETSVAKLEVLTEQDYTVAAMLFGIRSKYYDIPLSLRQYSGVQEYISYLMAKYAHDSRDTGLQFKEYPVPFPCTVMDMIISKQREKSKRLGFLYWLCNKHKELQNCFDTVMPNKKFVHEQGKSTYPGVVIPDVQINESEFFKIMSKIGIDDKLYEAIVKKYKSV